jgi:2-polyprenyl-6-methoxyphenol hydroxylase-like FAD-dependent oxidoreductase
VAEKPRIVVIGAGPAGMMLAHQLVSAGVSVHVLERHADFEREFRGELIGPSVLPVLDELGLMKPLVDRGLARTGVERRMLVGRTRHVTPPTGNERGALISQPGLLGLLHEECSKHPGYRLDFGRSATRLVRRAGRVVAVDTKDGRLEGDLFVLCNGRNNKLRRDVDVELDLDESPDDTLWLRFDLSDAKDALPAGVDVHMFGKGVVLVLFATTRSRLQIAYSAPGNVAALRKDYPALKAALLPLLSDRLREAVAPKIGDAMESQILRVAIDRVATWHAPGLLMLGDAAHTMGPAAAQGLNLAIRDAIVAANHLLAAIEAEKPLDADVLAAIEAERRREIEASQAVQLRAYAGVKKPLFVLHLMFAILGIVMRFKRFAPPPMPAVAPRRFTNVASTRA